jgi:predicted alpha/beta-hydrolase family hydrolase
MQTMLQTGTRRPPDRAPKLLAAFAEQIDQQPRTRPIFIAGKSMGGRMATLLAADPQYAYLPIAGVFAYGYPFFTPKNREQARCQHFKDSRCPLYILHGDRDSFGKPEELAKLTLPKIAHLHWIMQGNHDFIPLKSSGLHQGQLIAQLAKMTADCIRLQLSSTN